MEEIVVIGGGGHARVVLSILGKLKRFNILGYTDLRDHGPLLGHPFLGPDSGLAAIVTAHPALNVAIGVGQVGLGDRRRDLWTRLAGAAPRLLFPAIVSPHAVVNEDVVLGDAAVVMDGVVVNCGVRIGRGAILNTHATIEHDVVLEEWVHIAPGATLSGGVTVGHDSMIGAGATVIEGIRIPPDTFIGAGSTVIDSLTEPGVYAGSPARRIR
ncbi:MAG: NeuD/PglB/VioB family sugar acetyltransferase [Terracidiphilus sp.]